MRTRGDGSVVAAPSLDLLAQRAEVVETAALAELLRLVHGSARVRIPAHLSMEGRSAPHTARQSEVIGLQLRQGASVEHALVDAVLVHRLDHRIAMAIERHALLHADPYAGRAATTVHRRP